jgi:biopolymer transport protein ExbD
VYLGVLVYSIFTSRDNGININKDNKYEYNTVVKIMKMIKLITLDKYTTQLLR